MKFISVVGFILCAHSLYMILKIIIYPKWYINGAIEAGIKPNMFIAILIKTIIALIGALIGFNFMWSCF